MKDNNEKTDWSVVCVVLAISFIAHSIAIFLLAKENNEKQEKIESLYNQINEVIINKRECPGMKLNKKEILI